MNQFEPEPDSLIIPAMLRQKLIPDVDEALRLIHLDAAATGADTKISLAVGATCLVSASGCLALAGLTAPILVPLFGVGAMALAAWNSRVTQSERDWESQFISDHPEIMAAVEQKAEAGEDLHRVASAYEQCYRNYLDGGKPQLRPAPTATETAVTETVPTATAPTATAPTTQLVAIPVRPIVEPPTPPETYPMAAKEVSRDDRQALIARLKQDCPLLLKLVKSHPIRAVGAQRTGKTTLVKRLALLRMVLLPGHGVVAATPHHEPANPYPNIFTLAGVTAQGKRDYPAIEREWDGMAALVDNCQTSNRTYVWDEFGLFDKAVSEEQIKAVLTSCLRETMKFGIYPVFIIHGETQVFLPGSKGLVTVFIASTVRVETIGEPVEDDMGLETIRPTGKFNVTWLDGTREEGKIPDWLTDHYLLALIGDQTAQPIAQPPKANVRKPEINLGRSKRAESMVDSDYQIGDTVIDVGGDDCVFLNGFIEHELPAQSPELEALPTEWERQPTKAAKGQSFAKVKKRAPNQVDAEALDEVFGLVLTHYGRIIKEQPALAAAATKRLKQARALENNGNTRAALHCLITLPIAPNVTQFCNLFGINSGESFKRVSAVYHWAKALEEDANA